MSKQQGINLEDMPEVIFGAEDDDNSAGDDNSNGSGSSSGDSNDSSGDSSSNDNGAAGSSSNDASGQNQHDDADDPKVKGLKTALDTERKANKATAKELARLQKEKADRDLSEKTEVEQSQIRERAAIERATRLAEGILKRDLDDAIKRAAANFLDPSDAIEGVDRSKLVFDQDEDNPNDITIDMKTVEQAVKNLATKKPHYLKKGTDDGEPTGGQFGGSNRKKKTEDETYKDLYPSLR